MIAPFHTEGKWAQDKEPPTITHSDVSSGFTRFLGGCLVGGQGPSQSCGFCSLSTSPRSSETVASALASTSREGGRAGQYSSLTSFKEKASSRCPLCLMGQERPWGHPQDRGLGKLVFSFSRLHGADLHPEKRAWGVEWVTGSWHPLRVSPASQAPGPESDATAALPIPSSPGWSSLQPGPPTASICPLASWGPAPSDPFHLEGLLVLPSPLKCQGS